MGACVVKVALGLTFMITCTVVANLLMKLGAIARPEDRILRIVDWKTLAGLTSFGFAGLTYAWILAFLPLNVAQSYTAAQFVAVIFASAIVLSEPISMTQWVGISLIFAGIMIVGVGRGTII